jgi:hypothetical protein
MTEKILPENSAAFRLDGAFTHTVWRTQMAKAIRRASKRDGAAVLRELNKAIIRDAITYAELGPG